VTKTGCKVRNCKKIIDKEATEKFGKVLGMFRKSRLGTGHGKRLKSCL
jgi:hypothetical protein